MFCNKCGANMKDDAAFCPSCGAPNLSAQQTSMSQASGPVVGSSAGGVKANDVQKYLVRGIVGIVAIILAVVAIVFLMRLVSTIENVIQVFSGYDGLVSGLGIAGYVVCGLILAGCAALAALPVIRFALEQNFMKQAAIDRSMAFSIALLVLCVAVWICKLIFHSAIGSDVSGVLFTIFSTFGETATSCLVPVVIAIVILYIVRTKLISAAGIRG